MLSYQPKLALVHDDFIQKGGAERLFEEIAKIFPDSPIYTSLVDWSKITQSIAKDRLRTSFLQKIPFAKYLYKVLLPLYPLAFENFNFDKYDVVISSTTRFAKAIITKPKTIHICYINSTPRFLWDKDVQKEYMPWIIKILTKPLFFWLRKWDLVASARPDYYIANSQNVAKSVKKIYGRESAVVYPFVDTDFFVPAKGKPQDVLLVVTRLTRWKKIEIAIETARKLKKKLIIVGDGPDKARLKKFAANNPNVFFTGRVNSQQLRLYYQFAHALIVTQKEDFGIAAAEAQACGTPVIAYGRGGQKEIIIDGKTGVFFNEQTANSLQSSLGRASKVKWSKQACRKNSLHFTKERFIENLKTQVTTHVN